MIWLPPRAEVAKVDPGALRFIFESEYLNPSNKMQYQLHGMHLHSDFKETLMTLGYLPEVTVDNVVKLEQEKKELEMLVAAISTEYPELIK